MEEAAPIRALLSLKGYDFVDFGCSSGGSIQFARDKFGGGRGLGLDIDPAKVAKTRAKGFEAEVADVSQLDPESLGTVRFAMMAHFLEHLPTLDLAAKCIRSAVSVARQFVFIRQPYFDADQYLGDLGLQAYWSNWHGHTNHMTTHDFRNILWELEARGVIRRLSCSAARRSKTATTPLFICSDRKGTSTTGRRTLTSASRITGSSGRSIGKPAL